MISTERLKELNDQLEQQADFNKVSTTAFDLKVILKELIEAREKLAILSTMKHDDCTQLAEANEVIKFYAGLNYSAHDNHGYGDISEATEDAGSNAREYQKKWGLK